MRYLRELNLQKLLKQKSFFLFGPRSTGKSYLIREQLAKQAFVIDLLKSHWFLKLSQSPGDLEEILKAQAKKKSMIVIDEVQKVPELLSEVHHLLENSTYRFLLTGSSARKLKKSHADLLAGRAWIAELFPLTWKEIPHFNLDSYLRYGGLPQVYASENPEEELDAYVRTYLKEEILAEGIIRKLPPFSRFLKLAALSNGDLLNMTQLGSDAGIAPSTIREYYSVLEDTLLGFFLEPWVFSKKRKAIQTAKFYFFDTGVVHHLAGTEMLDRNSSQYGASFEQWMGIELRAYLSYRRIKKTLTFWRTQQGAEVDFLIGDHTAIEVKATTNAQERHLKGLLTLREEKVFKKYYLITRDKITREKEGVTFFYWEDFLKKLWADEIGFK
ncbi:MAG: ATP-binding protein [Deltaproteobacteria bacterium]|nr:ATP-binding protein [Deltaproteobacteria bacterium]